MVLHCGRSRALTRRAGQHDQGKVSGMVAGENLAVVGQEGEVTLQGPAMGLSVLGAPEVPQGLLAGFGAEFLPAQLLGLPGGVPPLNQGAVPLQFRGGPAEIRGELEGQPLHRHDGQAQPAAVEQKHGQLAIPIPRLAQAVEGGPGPNHQAGSEGGRFCWH